MDPNSKKRPREDDVLEVILYPQFCYDLGVDQVTEDMLYEEIKKYKQEIEPFAKDYFWHRDNLTFKPKTKHALQIESVIDGAAKPTELDLIPHIYTKMRFDEDIGDEWFVVFLIYNLTKKFNGLIARINDSDGEFLLIEAAEELPVWVTPETCQNKVFVMNNAIHIIHEKQNIHYNILNNIYQRSHIFRMSDKVQNEIHKKLAVYPEEIRKREHKARAYLPEKAACILKKEPQLVASAIRAICHSDPWERKVCRAMRYFPPEQRQMVNVKMTKCLYAMSTHCRYTGDPKTGWNLPPSNSSKYNAYLQGVRIACGLEILIARANDKKAKKVDDSKNVDNDDESIFEGSSWMKFYKRLEVTGYFKGLLEESKEYQGLLQKAKEYFLCNVKNSVIEDSCMADFGEAKKVLDIWREISSCDVETEVRDDSGLSPEDSTSWLNIDPDQLDAMLEQKFNFDNIDKDCSKPLGVQDKVKAFLNQKSDVDGVGFYSDQRKDSKNEMDDGHIEFDVEVFENTIKGILDLVVPGEDGEFNGSSEDSCGEDEEGGSDEMEEYMKTMDAQLDQQLIKDSKEDNFDSVDLPEFNLRESMIEEAGGSGPVGNIFGGPIQRLKQLNLENGPSFKSSGSPSNS